MFAVGENYLNYHTVMRANFRNFQCDTYTVQCGNYWNSHKRIFSKKFRKSKGFTK